MTIRTLLQILNNREPELGLALQLLQEQYAGWALKAFGESHTSLVCSWSWPVCNSLMILTCQCIFLRSMILCPHHLFCGLGVGWQLNLFLSRNLLREYGWPGKALFCNFFSCKVLVCFIWLGALSQVQVELSDCRSCYWCHTSDNCRGCANPKGFSSVASLHCTSESLSRCVAWDFFWVSAKLSPLFCSGFALVQQTSGFLLPSWGP